MKITHRVPVRGLVSDPITPEYQAEVDRSTAKLEREYAAAERRLEAAERRARRAEAAATSGKHRKQRSDQLAAQWAEVEYRRQELAKLAALMMPAGASAANRGRKSFRPVPITHKTGAL